MESLVERLKKECVEKEIVFVQGRKLKICVDSEVVFEGEAEDEAVCDLFVRADAALSAFYVENVMNKVSELSSIPLEQLEGEVDPDYGDYIDVYTPTLYAEKVACVKIGHTPTPNVWTYRPLQEVVKELEKQLK